MICRFSGPLWLLILCLTGPACGRPDPDQPGIPLPEHPRPDFQRSEWLNLNGSWQFRFDADNAGLRETWFEQREAFPLQITVPFPWGSELSGVTDLADIGWYARTITVPAAWQGQRVFLVVGASDWHTHGLARRPEAGRTPGRLHAVFARPDAARAFRARSNNW